MEKVKYIYLWLIISLFSQRINAQQPFDLSSLNIVEVRGFKFTPLRFFKGKSLDEDKAVFQAIELLKSKNLIVDDFYMSDVEYPDPLDKESTDIYTLVFDIVHKSSLIYLDSIIQVNIRLEKKHKGEDFIPIVLGATGNISGQDRYIYYDNKTNTIYDFMAQ